MLPKRSPGHRGGRRVADSWLARPGPGRRRSLSGPFLQPSERRAVEGEPGLRDAAVNQSPGGPAAEHADDSRALSVGFLAPAPLVGGSPPAPLTLEWWP